MKKTYEVPEIEKILFESSEAISESFGGGNGELPESGWKDWVGL